LAKQGKGLVNDKTGEVGFPLKAYFDDFDRATLRHSLERSPSLSSEAESENFRGILEGPRVYL
jgi:hypothetical protein